MKLPVKIAETKDSRAVIVRDERGEWICETWPHIAKEIVAALNGRTAPEDGGITQALVQMARDNAIAETELRVLMEISDELSLHGHGLAAARIERKIHLLSAPQG